MIETYSMLGEQRRADFDREASRSHRAAQLPRRPRARLGGLTAAVAVALLAVLVFAQPSPAAGQDGPEIAFTSNRTGNFEIWAMNDDGSNPVQLTNTQADDIFPDWSSDGSRIAFARGARPFGTDVWVMNADGTNQRRLTANGVGDMAPSWSPDGKKIAFVRVTPSPFGPNFDLYVMNADGTGERQLTGGPDFDTGPAWSPDGRTIAFTSDRSGAGTLALYTIRPNGSQLTKLTDDSLDAFVPGWSPDGGRLAFSDHASFGEGDLFVMNADGTGLTQLFETERSESHPTWSPDGGRLAFESWAVAANGSLITPSGEIYSVAADGSGMINLTNRPGATDEHPDWRP